MKSSWSKRLGTVAVLLVAAACGIDRMTQPASGPAAGMSSIALVGGAPCTKYALACGGTLIATNLGDVFRITGQTQFQGTAVVITWVEAKGQALIQRIRGDDGYSVSTEGYRCVVGLVRMCADSVDLVKTCSIERNEVDATTQHTVITVNPDQKITGGTSDYKYCSGPQTCSQGDSSALPTTRTSSTTGVLSGKGASRSCSGGGDPSSTSTTYVCTTEHLMMEVTEDINAPDPVWTIAWEGDAQVCEWVADAM